MKRVLVEQGYHVTVAGNTRLSNGEVEALVEGIRGQNILRLNLDLYRRRLMESPWVAAVAMFVLSLLVTAADRTEMLSLVRSVLHDALSPGRFKSFGEAVSMPKFIVSTPNLTSSAATLVLNELALPVT